MRKMDVCIYGVGRYGISTYYKLVRRGINIICFGDQNTSKQGYVVKDISCIPFEKVLELDKDKTVIVVAIKQNNAQLVNTFREKGFRYVCSYNNIKDNTDEKIPLTEQYRIEKEKEYLEHVILTGDMCDESCVSDDIKEMAEALRKRGKYEGIGS